MIEAIRTRHVLALYGVSFFLPAVLNPDPTPSRGLIEMWGWQAARLSIVPLLFLFEGEPGVLLLMTASNPTFLAAAACVAMRWRRTALAFALTALASMIACALMLPGHPGRDFIYTPGGHLGPGYYLWAGAGLLMCVVAYRSPGRSA